MRRLEFAVAAVAVVAGAVAGAWLGARLHRLLDVRGL